VLPPKTRRRSGGLLNRTGERAPDLRGVFRNGAVGRKLSRACDIENAFLGPIVRRAIELGNPLIGLKVGAQVGEVHVIVAVGEERAAQWLEDSRLVLAEMIGEDKSRAARVSGSFS
jgi:hypothetical protein